ncbi:MAG: patatin-like phospholipase family protein [Bacteroidetes bacterium]|nr:patatin-like phospholipase family protein [Bacteroidota bacterium]
MPVSATSKIKKYFRTHPAFRRFFYSFYFRLFLLDFKKNHFLLALWLLLFGMVTSQVLPRYGIAFIFLGPEYLNKISFFSYFITGFACGGFIMAYNMASFIKNAFRFPFLATLRRPFAKYSLNNFFFPLLFIIIYSYQIAVFLKHEELMPFGKILLMLFSFWVGIAVFIFILNTYLFGANKNVHKAYGIINTDEPERKASVAKKADRDRNPYLVKESRDWYVETYLTVPFMARRVRSVRHYKKEVLNAVLKRYQRSAFIFQLLAILSLIAMGLVSNSTIFILPTSASILLFLTVFVMLFSSFYIWFRGWTTVVFILFLVALNYMHKVNFLRTENRAYGLNYSSTAIYSYQQLRSTSTRETALNFDINTTLDILGKWKKKNEITGHPEQKPKLILVNTSGGGLRSSLWSLYSLQYADSVCGGELLKHIQMITGSSGGMIGAAYMRELYLRKCKGEIENYYSNEYRRNMAKDILSPIAFSIVTNEWVFPFRSFTVDQQQYPQDRGYVFERTLQDNVGNVFNKRLEDYRQPEMNSEIPMMVFSSTIVNDGRKLLISPLGISYLTQNRRTYHVKYDPLFDAIEYSRFFKQQDAGKTLFTSVMRMSATFPYIMPMVSLPSKPRIEMIDAGLRDNYGLETSLQFIKTFNDWIAENTSGVIIIQIRDKHKKAEIDDNPPQTLAQTLNRPMGSFYGNLFQVQDFNQNEQLQTMELWTKSNVEIIDFQLRNEANDRISLSWHLTDKEKEKVMKSIDLPENQKAIRHLRELLNQ